VILVLKVVMQNKRDFVDIFLLYRKRHVICNNQFLCVREFLVHVKIVEHLLLIEVFVGTHLCAITMSLLTLRRLMPYIYMERLFLMFLDHTQRRSTVGRTPVDE